MSRQSAFIKNGISLAAAALIVLPCAPLLAAGVDAGTLIENRAEATFETPQGSQITQSNTVTVRVDEILDVALASLDSGPITTATTSVALSFSVTNTGNGPEAFTLNAEPAVAGNDFDLQIDGIAIDTNGNGIYDDGVDLLLSTPEVTPEIAADGALTVFVLATVPNGTADGERSKVELQASAATGSGAAGTTISGAGTDGTDAIVGVNGAQAISEGEVIFASQSVSLVKTATVLDPFGGSSAVPGATISYSIEVSVSGSGSVDNLTVTDPIPPGTTYLPATLTLNAAALSDASGDDAGEVTASGVSVALGTVAAGTSNTIQFDVRIDE
ncbi:DUF11 domain-containing protein [Erythrobacter sp. SCSIO 43205]|uniref:hypothetical protein n=1 Tax=Erythrobacter sp. SCSIO 43205 TaxID=2779361 RepID=UPI001CA84FC1|nr:hypothetical protein [Erythrobacter sp. SCSIO 43205]UAB77733.1 DUF11 domain-containing protein [Erythrobacter sp. SCSIO 43205]